MFSHSPERDSHRSTRVESFKLAALGGSQGVKPFRSHFGGRIDGHRVVASSGGTSSGLKNDRWHFVSLQVGVLDAVARGFVDWVLLGVEFQFVNQGLV